MKTIRLIDSNKTAIVDDDIYKDVLEFAWFEDVRKHTTYAVSYVGTGIWSMHTFITGFKFVDHINHDGLDNRRENLRDSNSTFNSANMRKPKLRSEQSLSHPTFKGVTKMKSGRWQASITSNYRKINLGNFSTAEEAAMAYDEAALKLWGSHASLNFPKL